MVKAAAAMATWILISTGWRVLVLAVVLVWWRKANCEVGDTVVLAFPKERQLWGILGIKVIRPMLGTVAAKIVAWCSGDVASVSEDGEPIHL
jgi:hypothetical protein